MFSHYTPFKRVSFITDHSLLKDYNLKVSPFSHKFLRDVPSSFGDVLRLLFLRCFQGVNFEHLKQMRYIRIRIMTSLKISLKKLFAICILSLYIDFVMAKLFTDYIQMHFCCIIFNLIIPNVCLKN